MMRASLLLVVTFLTNRSTARPQEPPWQLWEDHHDGFDEAAWPQPFAVESIRNTYEGNDLPLQPQALYPDVDTAFLAYFSDSDHSNIDEEFPPPLSPVVPTELSSTEASIGIEYAEYVPETISYNQVPWETWPVDPPPKVFPFNCWQEDKDGYLCKDSQCQMAFAYDPEQVGIRFCCDRWDDLVVPKCVPAPVEEQFVAMIDGREAR